MDLRIVKTRKNIRDAFLQMRRNTPLEKVKVRDLCRIALINKSTFYNHYEDVFALSAELEDEVLTRCIEDFTYKDCLFSDPQKFLENVPQTLEQQGELISILFSDRKDVLYVKLRRKIRDYYRKPDMTPQEDVALTFLIGGMMYAMQELTSEKKYTESEITQCIVNIISHISK